MQTYELAYSISQRAKCQTCKEKIAKDIVRFGTLVIGDEGSWTAWRHLNCVPPWLWKKAIAEGRGSVTGIKGYRTLAPNDQALVRAAAAGLPLPPPPKVVPTRQRAAAPKTPGKRKKRAVSDEEEAWSEEEAVQGKKGRAVVEGGDTTSEEEWLKEEMQGELSEESG